MTDKRCPLSARERPTARYCSSLETLASLALWWAARRRATFSSGVSIRIGFPSGEPPDGGREEVLGGLLKRAVLESAWGVVAVKRVASETLRGVVDIGMVVLVSGW